MKNQQKGSPGTLILMLIVIVLLASIGYLYFKKTTVNSISNTSSSTVQLQSAGWKTYSSPSLGLTFQYPSDLTLTDITAQQPSQALTVQLTSADSSTTVIFASVQNWSPKYSTICSHADEYLQEQKLSFLTYDQVTINGIQYVREEALSGYGSAKNNFSDFSVSYSASNANKQCYSFGFNSNPVYKSGTMAGGRDSISNLDMDSEKQVLTGILQTVKI